MRRIKFISFIKVAGNPLSLASDTLKNSMQSNRLANKSHRLGKKKIICWIAVALYTAALPFVILAFRAIEQHFSPQTAGRIPLLIIAVLAGVYGIVCIRHKAAAPCIIVLIVGAVIVFLVVAFEKNANKYIHIPEYIIMTWLLYLAIGVDYRGSGILLLVFLCALMLGIVDELLQGIHPLRTYGVEDMIIDAASSFIGILSLIRLKTRPERNWGWGRELKRFKGALGVLLIGIAASVPMCFYLLDVQQQGNFLNAYPRWLLAGNGLLIAACVAVIVLHWRHRQRFVTAAPEIDQIALNNHTTAMLWVICPLAILLWIQALVVWVAVAGINFR